jgi:hypothetical protein
MFLATLFLLTNRNIFSSRRECILRCMTISTGIAAFLLIIVITLLAMQAEDDGNYNNLRGGSASSTSSALSSTTTTTTATTTMANTLGDTDDHEKESMNNAESKEQDKMMAISEHDHDGELKQEQEEKTALLQHHEHDDEEDDEEEGLVSLLQETETEELNVEESLLFTALRGMGNTIRIGLGRLFGSNEKYDEMSDEQVESIAEEVEKRLNIEITEELRQQADAILQTNVQVLQETIDAAQEEEEIKGNIVDKQERDEYVYKAMDMVRTEIDQAALDLNDQMPALVIQIEKEILEEEGFSN